jgi:hypothetical protein
MKKIFQDFYKSNMSQNPLDSLGTVTMQYTNYLEYINPDYTFPDEDFCMFLDFPHNRLVFPILFGFEHIKCTCTLMYLVQYSHTYNDVLTKLNLPTPYLFYRNDDIFTACANWSSELAEECFSEREKLCVSLTNRTAPSSEPFLEDYFFQVYFVKYIMIIILAHVSCLVGFILNFIIIRTIKKKE